MASSDYQRVAAAVEFLERHASTRPPLAEVAAHVDLSPHHFQRLFRRWAGVSPKQFLQAVTVAAAKQRLQASASLLDTAFAVGLSGTGRLHDLFVTVEAVTPGDYKRRGRGLHVRYGFHPSPLGEALLALTERGICHLAFVEPGTRTAALAELAETWPAAARSADDSATARAAARIFGTPSPEPGEPLRLFLRGTNFQLQIWRALLRIPEGALTSYGDLAARLGRPGSARAVGRAVASNPVAYLVPCHRVLRASGALGGYRWGTSRKRALLARELAAASPGSHRGE